MKNSLIAMLISCALSGMAQLPVDTIPTNKNVVLELFQGMYCRYSPYGDLAAETFKAANPNDVVLVTIHTGWWADPQNWSGQQGYPDFRIGYGAVIAGQTNLAGYPAGTINRREFSGMQQSGSGTAMSRGAWATAGSVVLSEPSYVNIAAEGHLNYAANTLTINVETYFTGNSPGSDALLNVAILQNNVVGPQLGALSNPGQTLPNGDYNHMHMLRDLVTGQWGDTISTTQGVVNSYTYTWNIPNEINGVLVNIGDLEIAAFIAEDRDNIVTGVSVPITINLPQGVSFADLEAEVTPNNVNGYCEASIAPEFLVKNNESFAIDSAEAMLVFNGSAAISQWVTNIPANGSKLVKFPMHYLMPGTDTMGFSVSVTGVYGYLDSNASNNSVKRDFVYSIDPNAVSRFPVTADFEADAPLSSPSGFISTNESNIMVIDQSRVAGVYTSLGAYQKSEKSVLFYYANMEAGETVSLISEKISLSGASGSEVQFDYSYAVKGTVYGDQLNVYISGDCGASWIRIFDGTGGAGLETAPATSSIFFPALPTDWTTISANITPADGAEIMVKFEAISAGGNMLYVDNIMVDGKPIGIAEVNAAEAVSVYPNPASDNVFVELDEATDFTVELTSTDGQVVRVADFSNTAKAQLNVSDLAKGIYILNVNSDKGSSSQRITIVD